MRLQRQALMAALVLFLGIPGGAAASGDVVEPRLQSSIRSLGPSGQVAVIIHLAQKSPSEATGRDRRSRRAELIRALRSEAEGSQRQVLQKLLFGKARHVRPLWLVNGIAASVETGQVAVLAALPGVERIVLDATVHAPELAIGTLAAPEWNLAAIGAPDLWSRGITGQGTVVANMDTGIDYDHPDLQSRWRGGTNSWFDPHSEHPLMPYDATGHGTQTMGILVGGDAGGTSIGVAPGAQWIAVKLFNDAGTTTYSVIHQAFQWLLDPDGNPETDDAPDVVNHSWGLIDPTHSCVTEFRTDVQVLKNAGIALSFSAGNDGPAASTGVSPANYPESFSVGAVDSTNTVAFSSSRGPSACYGDFFPRVVAPGVNVRTADLFLGIPEAYVSVSGTSFAAPHAAGAFALLRSAVPGIGVQRMEHALMRSAVDLGAGGADNEHGSGLVYISDAHRLLLRYDPGVFRNGRWFRDWNENLLWDAGTDRVTIFGGGADVPLAGDWDGDGVSEIGVFSGEGLWRLDTNGDGTWDPGVDAEFTYGMAGDVPVSGDWNGDGRTDVGVFRGSGMWLLDTNGNHVLDAGDAAFTFGLAGDVPVTGDWVGDGTTRVGVFRNGFWYLDSNGNGAWNKGVDVSFRFGIAGDIPVTGDWTGGRTGAKAGVYRGNGYWYLDTDGNGSWNGGVDATFKFGIAGDRPVVGVW